MFRLATLTAAAAFAVGLAGTAVAQGGPPVVVLTGGGIVQNNDSGLGDLTSVGGFVAIAKGIERWGDERRDGVDRRERANPSQLVNAANPTQNLSTLHGKVVCIALLVGGDMASGDYEVRFVVTRSSGDFPIPVGDHGSLFINDSGLPSEGGTDMADENFSDEGNPNCDEVGGSAHEPIVSGNFTVH